LLHLSNMPIIFVTFSVLNLETLSEVRAILLVNMLPIFVTL